MKNVKYRLACATFIILGATGFRAIANAEEPPSAYMYCSSDKCPKEARCSGDFSLASGCRIDCVLWYGGGFFIPNGYADCARADAEMN